MSKTMKYYFSEKFVSESEYVYGKLQIKEVFRAYPDIKGAGAVPIAGLDKTVSFNSDNGRYGLGYYFTPQSICFFEDYFLLASYDGAHIFNSVIYVCDKHGNYILTIILNNHAHCGGMAYDKKNDYVWVSNSKSVIGISGDEIRHMLAIKKKRHDLSAVRFEEYKKQYDTRTQASFVHFYGGLLWVGKFSMKGPDEIYAYKVDLKKDELETVYRMEAPRYAQGIAFYKAFSGDGSGKKKLCLAVSTSRGPFASRLRFYEPDLKEMEYDEETGCPVILKRKAVKVLKLPPQSEGVVVRGKYLYILFESAARPFRRSPLYRTTRKLDRVLCMKVKS